MLLMLCLCLGHYSTDRLQPFDLIPNNIFKQYLSAEFHLYYSKEMQKQLTAGPTESTDINIDICSSVIKCLHAQIYSTLLLKHDSLIPWTCTKMIYNSEITRSTSLKSCALYINCMLIKSYQIFVCIPKL